MGPRLLAFIAVVFWGLSFVATRIALRDLSPVTLIFVRFVLGLILLHGLLAVRRAPFLPPRPLWPQVAAMGFVGIFVHMLLQAYALRMTTAVRTGWLIGVIPIWSALLAALFLRERFGMAKVGGLLLGLAGVILIVTRGRFDPETFALPSTHGDLLVLISTVTWAVYTVISHGATRALGGLRATAGAMLVGWLLLAPFFIASHGWTELARVPVTGWLSVLFLGFGCSGLAYWFWGIAVSKTETSKVAAFLYLEPLVTLAAAVPILGETVGPSTLLGGAIVLAGVALVQRAGKAA